MSLQLDVFLIEKKGIDNEKYILLLNNVISIY